MYPHLSYFIIHLFTIYAYICLRIDFNVCLCVVHYLVQLEYCWVLLTFVVLWILKYFFSTNLCYKLFFDLMVSVSSSIVLNFTCLLKTWFLPWKCIHVNITSGFLTSFRWLFSLTLKLVFVFLTYLFLSSVHLSRYTIEQLTSWKWNTMYD